MNTGCYLPLEKLCPLCQRPTGSARHSQRLPSGGKARELQAFMLLLLFCEKDNPSTSFKEVPGALHYCGLKAVLLSLMVGWRGGGIKWTLWQKIKTRQSLNFPYCKYKLSENKHTPLFACLLWLYSEYSGRLHPMQNTWPAVLTADLAQKRFASPCRMIESSECWATLHRPGGARGLPAHSPAHSFIS